MVRRVKPTFIWVTMKSDDGKYYRMRMSTDEDVTAGDAQVAGHMIVEKLKDDGKTADGTKFEV